VSFITRNSVKCNTCDVEIESTHRNDFKVHYCPNNPSAAKEWYKDEAGVDRIRVKVPFEQTWNFAVDGGKSYFRRCGTGFTDTSTSLAHTSGKRGIAE
jgi:Zn-finger nucleic acid-binding protein